MQYLYEILMFVLGFLIGWFIWRGSAPKVPSFSSNTIVQLIVIIIIAIVVIWIVGLVGLVAFIIGLLIGFFLKKSKSSGEKDWKMR